MKPNEGLSISKVFGETIERASQILEIELENRPLPHPAGMDFSFHFPERGSGQLRDGLGATFAGGAMATGMDDRAAGTHQNNGAGPSFGLRAFAGFFHCDSFAWGGAVAACA